MRLSLILPLILIPHITLADPVMDQHIKEMDRLSYSMLETCRQMVNSYKGSRTPYAARYTEVLEEQQVLEEEWNVPRGHLNPREADGLRSYRRMPALFQKDVLERYCEV